jgi:hypothetical protein
VGLGLKPGLRLANHSFLVARACRSMQLGAYNRPYENWPVSAATVHWRCPRRMK